jgi:hypothetical protein
MKKLLFICMLIATALAACTKREEPAPPPEQPIQTKTGTVKIPVYRGAELRQFGEVERFIDGDAGVVCYRSTYQASISCVPLSHTYLRGDGSSRAADADAANKY